MLTLTIYACRTAAERNMAHHIERLLAVNKNCRTLVDAREKLKALVPDLKGPEHLREHHLEHIHGDTSATLLLRLDGRPYISITQPIAQ